MTGSVGCGDGTSLMPTSVLSQAPARETRRSSAAPMLDPKELALQHSVIQANRQNVDRRLATLRQ
jgi:hypothetical protein